MTDLKAVRSLMARLDLIHTTLKLQQGSLPYLRSRRKLLKAVVLTSIASLRLLLAKIKKTVLAMTVPARIIRTTGDLTSPIAFLSNAGQWLQAALHWLTNMVAFIV